jgi:hypothetical protein
VTTTIIPVRDHGGGAMGAIGCEYPAGEYPAGWNPPGCPYPGCWG